MSRHRKDPLRPLTADERQELTRLSRSLSAPAAQVERARALLAIADGASYTAAAHQVGRRHNETISAWVSRFNRDGLAAVRPGHGGGPRIRYGADAQQRILAEWARTPQREQDGTATWSLSLLQKALRQAPDGLPRVSTFTIWRTLHAGRPELAEEPHLVRNRRGDAPAQARCGARQRSRCDGQKELIEQAYTLGAQLGLSVWCEDEAGPFQAVPHPGVSWQPRGQPATQPHEYIRGGTTKILTLFHPATGQVRLQPAARGTNAVLHPWLRERLSAILAELPPPGPSQDPAATQAAWAVWQAGLTMPFTLPHDSAAAAAVAGVGQSHRPQDARPGAVAVRAWRHAALHARGRQLAQHGGVDRARAQAPGARRAASAQPRRRSGAGLSRRRRRWNEQPTPFVWNGKRRQRRRRSGGDQTHRLGGSGACTHRPLRRNRATGAAECQIPQQMTH